MPVFVNPKATTSYVLERQRDVATPAGADPVEAQKVAEENQRRAAARVTFVLGIIPAVEFAGIEDLVHGDASSLVGTVDLRLLRGGLRGWSGGDAPTFEARGPQDPRPSEESLARLLPADRHELARAIMAMHSLSDADAGKS